METMIIPQPANLIAEAQKLLAEAAGTKVERSKRSLPAAAGLQTFLLYVRANGRVPDHRVKGPITVQTVIGHASMTAEGKTFDLPAGSLISFGADVVHDVSALEDSVLLVTHAMAHE